MKRFGLAVMLAALLLTGACALAQSATVNNGASGKLNMREAPNKSAQTVAQFFSGTPVEIVCDAGGGWSQVTVGNHRGSMSGYMMTNYLSSGGEAVSDSTYDVSVVSPYGTQSVVLRDRPSNSYNAVAMLEVGSRVRVLGTSGNYLVVRTNDGCVGCLSSDETQSF